MMSIRAFSRSIPRSLTRLAAPFPRRSLTTIRQPALLHSSWMRASALQATAPFSTSTRRCEKQGEVDEELVAKLDSELQMEKEMRDMDDMPASVRDYLDNGPFEVQDTAGQEEVVLTRKFGDETIRITFSTADLNSMDPENEPDRALYDEDDADEDGEAAPPAASAQSGGAQSKPAVNASGNAARTSGGNIAIEPEDSVAPADRAELRDSGASTTKPVANAQSAAEEDEDADEDDADDDEEAEPAFPSRVTVSVTKPNTGTLQLETVAQDGMIVIDNVYYHTQPVPAPGTSSPDTEFATRNAYLGPPFGNLDEDLQVLLERYLDERGVNTELALFIPDYIDWKEQREYLTWLENVKSFVES
ncbi:MAG: hypothetical protein M1833_001326 [Piccolia ochrophora]|nr:MAG: hypothetical protein M1833_001326 [Piccolia ochrophora]